MTNGPKKSKIKVHKTTSKTESKKGTTISVPPAEIRFTYESDFQSRPLWEIRKTGLGSWAKDKKGEWKKADFRDTPKIKGAFLELDSLEMSTGSKYVLIKHEGGEKWINVGKAKGTPKCGPSKRACLCGYRSEYEYATCRGAQYGIKGSAQVKYKDKTINFKLLAVTYKTHQDGKRSSLFTQVRPGLYKGYVQVRGKYQKKYKEEGLWKSLSIWFRQQWDEDTGKWIKGVKKGKDKSGKPITTINCFIHPAQFPYHLDGCLALGYKYSEYGFETFEDSRKAMLAVFDLIGVSTKDQFKKAQKEGHKGHFIITVTDIRSHTLVERVEGPDKVAVGCPAFFKVIRKAEAEKTQKIKWLVKDAKADAELKHYGNTEGDTLIIDCIPETWNLGTVQVVAYTVDPQDGLGVSAEVSSTEVGRFIALVRKAEFEYYDWSAESVLNSLRRLAGYDTERWQKMLGIKKPANDLNPTSILQQKDIKQLEEMSKHIPEKGIKGTAKDCFGNDVAMGHVLTGISAGQHRNTNVDLPRELYGIIAVPFGGKVDNLYATTISGDLGQSAVEVNEERRKNYIGPQSEATDAELIGDIDGFLIGENLDEITGGKSLFEPGSKGIKLSQVLQKYYCMYDSSKISAASRFAQFSRENTLKELLNQTKEFADTYVYASDGKIDGFFSKVGDDAQKAVEEFKKWLESKKQEEANRDKSKVR